MKKQIIFFFFFWTVLISGQSYAWQIENFAVDIDINKDSSIIVTETITADFSDQPKHGIFRKIPVIYRDEKGNRLNVSFYLLGVYDEEGNARQYKEYREGVYEVIKIGSPYITHNDKQIYVIKYKLQGALLFLSEHDELYWNTTGTEWDASIRNVRVKVRLPSLITEESIETKSYRGRYGSKQQGSPAVFLDQQTLFFSEDNFNAYEGLTIVVGWPKGVVVVPPAADLYSGSSAQTSGFSFSIVKSAILVLIFPLLVFLIMYKVWDKYGRDPQLLKSVVVEYKVPGDITPAEMGMFIDDRIDIRDISATIIDLAVRGYLKIIETESGFFQKQYSFQKLKDFYNDKTLRPFEKIILEGIFGSQEIGASISLSSLENKFYKQLSNIKEEIFRQLKEKGYYRNSPEATVQIYIILGIAVFVIALFSFLVWPLLGISLGLAAIIIFIYARYMPAKTRLGIDTYGKILGFEEFLSRTDKDKIQRQEQENIFERMLPYAMCLGIAKQWAGIFADIYKQTPTWYVGTYSQDRPFSLDSFIYDLNRSVSQMNGAFTTAPRTVSSGGGFGGGGSSGGGFGGGGGGSW